MEFESHRACKIVKSYDFTSKLSILTTMHEKFGFLFVWTYACMNAWKLWVFICLKDTYMIVWKLWIFVYMKDVHYECMKTLGFVCLKDMHVWMHKSLEKVHVWMHESLVKVLVWMHETSKRMCQFYMNKKICT